MNPGDSRMGATSFSHTCFCLQCQSSESLFLLECWKHLHTWEYFPMTVTSSAPPITSVLVNSFTYEACLFLPSHCHIASEASLGQPQVMASVHWLSCCPSFASGLSWTSRTDLVPLLTVLFLHLKPSGAYVGRWMLVEWSTFHVYFLMLTLCCFVPHRCLSQGPGSKESSTLENSSLLYLVHSRGPHRHGCCWVVPLRVSPHFFRSTAGLIPTIPEELTVQAA